MIRTFAGLAVGLLLVACERSEPPSRPEPSTRAARAPAPPATSSAAPAVTAKPAASVLQPAPSASAPAVSPAEDQALVPPAVAGADGKPLEQTEDKPTLESPWFKSGIRAVFRAIQRDDPELAKPFFFPVEAYRQVKDIKDPERDWKRRLIGNFERDVHTYHKKLGPDAERARFVSIEVPEEKMKWMKKGSEGNRIPYFRVTRSKLKYETADGKPGVLDVTSLISWRGEWYIVHLNGFE